MKLLAAATKGDLRGGKQQNGAKAADDGEANAAAGNGKADNEGTKKEEAAPDAADKTEKREETGEDLQEQIPAGEQEAAETEAEEGKQVEGETTEKE